MRLNRRWWMVRNLALIWLATLLPASIFAGVAKAPACSKISLAGEVQAGQEWKAEFGEGWVFRLVPVQKGTAGYSGWDLVVDRDPSAGYPDALLVATPPYYSISEREVGTTFGLRAQDAIGWNPRSFHFLTDPEALRESQKQFRALGGTKIWTEKPEASGKEQVAEQRLLELNRKSSAGQLRILNARLSPGTADAAPFAQRWALQSSRTPHTSSSSAGAKATPLGELEWMRFSVTLWLPAGWKTAKGVEAVRSGCSE